MTVSPAAGGSSFAQVVSALQASRYWKEVVEESFTSATPAPATLTRTLTGMTDGRAPVTHETDESLPPAATAQGTPLSSTLVTPGAKPEPVSVTSWPPSAEPTAGEMPVTAGVAAAL